MLKIPPTSTKPSQRCKARLPAFRGLRRKNTELVQNRISVNPDWSSGEEGMLQHEVDALTLQIDAIRKLTGYLMNIDLMLLLAQLVQLRVGAFADMIAIKMASRRE